MRKLLIYLNEYRKECILAPLFKLLEASFELIVPLVVAAIIDHGIAASNKSYIFKMGGVMVLLALIGLACSITAQYFAAKAAVGFSTKVRYALFSHIQKLSFSEMDTIGTSTLITRMTSDINQTQSGVNMVLRLFLRHLLPDSLHSYPDFVLLVYHNLPIRHMEPDILNMSPLLINCCNPFHFLQARNLPQYH